MNNRCPNCGGILELSKSRTMMVCPYCETKFDLDESEREKILNQGLFNEIFSVEVDFAPWIEKGGTIASCIESLKHCMNEIGSAEKVESYIRRSLLNGNDVAAVGINDKLLDAVRSRLDSELEGGERILLYYDQGIFSKGKEFTVITDKRCLSFTKKKCFSVYHKDIGFLNLDTFGNIPCWNINGSYDKRIPSMGPDGHLSGAAVALVGLLSFEQEPDRERIRIV